MIRYGATLKSLVKALASEKWRSLASDFCYIVLSIGRTSLAQPTPLLCHTCIWKRAFMKTKFGLRVLLRRERNSTRCLTYPSCPGLGLHS